MGQLVQLRGVIAVVAEALVLLLGGLAVDGVVEDVARLVVARSDDDHVILIDLRNTAETGDTSGCSSFRHR